MATRHDTFDTIQWNEYTTDSRSISRHTIAFVVVVLALALGFLYDFFFMPQNDPVYWSWNPNLLDWMFMLSLSIFFFYVLVPLFSNRELTLRRWRQLKTNRIAVASLCYLIFFFVAGLIAPMFLSPLRDAIMGADDYMYGIAPYNPPLGFTVPYYSVGITHCVGTLANNVCHGSFVHPFGTTGTGEDLMVEVLRGMRTSLEVVLITATIIAPLGSAVGICAAYFGGAIDEVLMRYVDIQQAIPPLFVFLLFRAVYDGSILLMILIFGFLGWGSTARLVRSEALQKRELGFMRAAEGAGSSHFRIIREHLLPNVSSTVLVSTTLRIPSLLLIQATIGFLKLNHGTNTWGFLIHAAFIDEFHPTYLWWQEAIPVLFIALTVASFSFFGDALREILDPRTREGL